MHPATPENGRKASTRPGLLENSFSTRKQPPELLRKVHRRRLPWRDPGVILVLRAEGDLGPIGIAIRQAPTPAVSLAAWVATGIVAVLLVWSVVRPLRLPVSADTRLAA